ncbi:MAG TPA: FKBP-type peptidyl-prolyl cis-trans isomerase [Gemmatimonadaceae bacterium]|nr:FKBP-type peptidyl-prolyl cis-trans isomerase [Gemmatimonadaceae bacterium]
MKRTAFLLATLAVAACNADITGLEPPSDPATETFAASLNINLSQMTRTSSGLFYEDVTVGSGKEVTDSVSTVNVTYAGFLKDGKLFDSGTNTVLTPALLIAGFREGLKGMKEGGRRKLVIPSALGYGPHSQRNTTDNSIKIPRQSTLIFDITLIKVTNTSTTTTT